MVISYVPGKFARVRKVNGQRQDGLSYLTRPVIRDYENGDYRPVQESSPFLRDVCPTSIVYDETGDLSSRLTNSLAAVYNIGV